MIYLDHNAAAPLVPAALEAMRPYLERHYGNPSSPHASGRAARAAIDDARDRLAALLGVRPHEIVFTSGGTESNNLAVLGLARARAGRGKKLITCATEHHAVLDAFGHLQKKEGFEVTWLPVDSAGRVDPDELAKAITPETTLVSVMTANNETGVLHPIEEIAAHCASRGVVLHTDAVQSFGKIPLSARQFDAVSIAGHKFGGPKGAGLLYLRAGLGLERQQHGGAQENDRRAGTENVPAIAGLAVAAELALSSMGEAAALQEQLRERLCRGVRAAFPAAVVNGARSPRLANTLNVSFPGLDGESLLMNLDLEGICVSSGAACMAGSAPPSHVLLAMGVAPDTARATVRFSLGSTTTEAEIDQAVECLPRILARLQPAAA